MWGNHSDVDSQTSAVVLSVLIPDMWGNHSDTYRRTIWRKAVWVLIPDMWGNHSDDDYLKAQHLLKVLIPDMWGNHSDLIIPARMLIQLCLNPRYVGQSFRQEPERAVWSNQIVLIPDMWGNHSDCTYSFSLLKINWLEVEFCILNSLTNEYNF